MKQNTAPLIKMFDTLIQNIDLIIPQDYIENSNPSNVSETDVISKSIKPSAWDYTDQKIPGKRTDNVLEEQKPPEPVELKLFISPLKTEELTGKYNDFTEASKAYNKALAEWKKMNPIGEDEEYLDWSKRQHKDVNKNNEDLRNKMQNIREFLIKEKQDLYDDLAPELKTLMLSIKNKNKIDILSYNIKIAEDYLKEKENEHVFSEIGIIESHVNDLKNIYDEFQTVKEVQEPMHENIEGLKSEFFYSVRIPIESLALIEMINKLIEEESIKDMYDYEWEKLAGLNNELRSLREDYKESQKDKENYGRLAELYTESCKLFDISPSKMSGPKFRIDSISEKIGSTPIFGDKEFFKTFDNMLNKEKELYKVGYIPHITIEKIQNGLKQVYSLSASDTNLALEELKDIDRFTNTSFSPIIFYVYTAENYAPIIEKLFKKIETIYNDRIIPHERMKKI